VKAFNFRLDSALRWRAAQVDVERNRVSTATAQLNGIRSAIEFRRRELSGGAAIVMKGSSGDVLHSWSGWVKRCNREILALEQRAQAAEQAVASCLRSLVQANQNMQLLGKLKQTAFSHWQAEAGRELEAFASETFLRQVTIGKRTGA
jgi:flagellar export protein FliJ